MIWFYAFSASVSFPFSSPANSDAGQFGLICWFCFYFLSSGNFFLQLFSLGDYFRPILLALISFDLFGFSTSSLLIVLAGQFGWFWFVDWIGFGFCLLLSFFIGQFRWFSVFFRPPMVFQRKIRFFFKKKTILFVWVFWLFFKGNYIYIYKDDSICLGFICSFTVLKRQFVWLFLNSDPSDWFFLFQLFLVFYSVLCSALANCPLFIMLQKPIRLLCISFNFFFSAHVFWLHSCWDV